VEAQEKVRLSIFAQPLKVKVRNYKQVLSRDSILFRALSSLRELEIFSAFIEKEKTERNQKKKPRVKEVKSPKKLKKLKKIKTQ
jgi:hypothetical protein